MKLTGKEEILKHLPNRPKYILKIYLFQVILITLCTVSILFIFDLLPRFFSINWLISVEPYIPFLGSIFAVFGGLTIVHLTWRKRDKLIAEDRKLAFEKSVKYTFTGIPIAMAGAIHGFLPFSWLADKIFSLSSSQNPVTSFLETSVGKLIMNAVGNPNYNDMIARIIFSVLILIIAIVNMRRTIMVFGIDTASMLYVYYPEESKIVKNEIYSIVRHPLYVSVNLLGISALVSNFSIYSIGIYLILVLGFQYHIRCIEDKELAERFGEEFKKYQKSVPSLIIRPKNWGKYVRFLIRKDMSKTIKNGD